MWVLLRKKARRQRARGTESMTRPRKWRSGRCA